MRHEAWDVACNWKVYVDNFLEGYHVPMVHPALADVVDYRNYEVELFDWYSLQHSPLQAGDDIYGAGTAYYYFVYPNVMLNVMPGRLQTNRVLPLGPGRCRVEFEWFYTPTAAAFARIDNDRAFTNAIQEEYVAICERVQLGLASGHYEAGRLCPRREAARVALSRSAVGCVRLIRSARLAMPSTSCAGFDCVRPVQRRTTPVSRAGAAP